MDVIKLFLSDIREHPHFNDFKKLVEDARPSLPRYDFRNDNTEYWKVNSGRIEGFDLFASLLNMKFEE